ncbi:hypothetical protein LCGC14_2507530, partial [marine sediment metagenome]
MNDPGLVAAVETELEDLAQIDAGDGYGQFLRMSIC